MSRMQRTIFKLQPLQADTVQLVPNSYIPGIIGSPNDLQGSALAAKVTLSRNPNVRMRDGVYRIAVTAVGAAGTGAYTITEQESGQQTGVIATAATKVAGLVGGIDVLVTDTTGCAVGDYCEFEVTGDQTFIIPGTVLGRVAGTHTWKPASDATIASFDAFTIAAGTCETDKTQTVQPDGYETSVSQVYSITVVVYAQVIEAACRAVNLTDNLKAKLQHIAWL